MTRVVLAVAALFACLRAAEAAVTGRYVRIDSMSPAMELSEVEIYAGGTNLLRGHPEKVTGGTGAGLYGLVDSTRQARELTDGNTAPAQRVSFRASDPTMSNAHIEFDMGASGPLDSVVFHVSRYDNPQIKVWFSDPEGWRVVSVLDDQRRVVFSQLVTLFTPKYLAAKGVMRVELTAPAGPFRGRAVALGSRGWFSLGEFLTDYLDVKEVSTPADPDRAARVVEFARRNTPAGRAAFAARFFADIDLDSPELHEVSQQLSDRRPDEALETFKHLFLKRLSYFDTLTPSGALYQFPADRNSGAIMNAQDLLNYRKVDRKARTVYVDRPGEVLDFSPSCIPWDQTHPRCLLLAYAATGERKYLERWAELLDERSIFFQRWADGGDRRDYWPLAQVGGFINLLRDLQATLKLRPALADELPAPALARFLSLYVEEAAPAYWRLARKTVFNHQFNIWGGVYVAAPLLRDFYVGQRLEREMEQHFERLWTLAETRDGSMIEVADIGHVPCPLGTPAYCYLQMKRDQPAWFTPDLETWFLHCYRSAARYPVRFVAPCGVEHRSGNDHDSYCFQQIYQLLMRERGSWVRPFLSEYADGPGAEELAGIVLREPEVRAIIDTVYGRGRQRATLSKERQACYDTATRCLAGGYQGLPQTVSDYMPYAGIHYLRRDWSPEASFIEMVCQPPGGSANDRFMDQLGESWSGTEFWDTQFHYWDFAEPLLLARPLQIDGQNQCQSFETKGWKPGSKTERLVEAPEKPLPNRFHCSSRYDYQECFFTGTYQNWELEYNVGPNRRARLQTSDTAVTGVHTTRQIIQLRPQRLFVVVDRVRFPDDIPHEVSGRYLMLPVDANARVETDGAKHEIRLVRPAGVQLVVRQFGVPDLAYERLTPIKGRTFLNP